VKFFNRKEHKGFSQRTQKKIPKTILEIFPLAVIPNEVRKSPAYNPTLSVIAGLTRNLLVV